MNVLEHQRNKNEKIVFMMMMMIYDSLRGHFNIFYTIHVILNI